MGGGPLCCTALVFLYHILWIINCRKCMVRRLEVMDFYLYCRDNDSVWTIDALIFTNRLFGHVLPLGVSYPSIPVRE
jgi:hypothetical protein